MAIHSTKPLRLARLTLDKAPPGAHSIWKRARRAEIMYAARLRKIAKHIGDIVRGFDPNDLVGSLWIETALRKYAEAITPWAQAAARSMVTEVEAREKRQWEMVSGRIGRSIRAEIESAPTGVLVQKAMAEQVHLIRSLPLDAAERVHKLVFEAMPGGKRASTLIDRIMDQGDISRSRAELIARTETGRLSTELTKARAMHAGSTMFIWRTAGDGNVRASHKRLNGKAFRWDGPPECDPGYHALPGAIFNCRCYPEPIYPDDGE